MVLYFDGKVIIINREEFGVLGLSDLKRNMEITNDRSSDQESEFGEKSPNESMDETEVAQEPNVPKKKKKKGIVYISSIPKFMTVSILREQLGRYATIGRVYLQAAETKGKIVC